MKNKLDFEHFVVFCLESAFGVSDVSLKSGGVVFDPALEAVREYFKKHRIKSKEVREIDEYVKIFTKTYQIREFYEKVYLADGQ